MQHIEMPKAQRRQLTILHGDIVGSTELAVSLDPEDFGKFLAQFSDAAREVMETHEGYLNRFAGDSVQVVFGYPQAHEDDADRAVRAGLALAAAVRRIHLRGEAHLEVRVGVATGRVVVGEFLGEGSPLEVLIVGEAAHLAARLQAEAEPGEVLISAPTRKLLGSTFELLEAGLRNLKGFAQPMEMWRVVAERPTLSRFEALRQWHDLTPFVGRSAEMRFLRARLELASAGRGQAVSILGEPGLGKSRLVEEFVASLADSDAAVLRYFCNPQALNTALFPIIRQLESAAGFNSDDNADGRLAKLQAVLTAQGYDAAEVKSRMPYLTALLSIRYGDDDPSRSDTPERRKEITVRILRELLLRIATRQSVLMIFEDLHWIDPTTLELVSDFVKQVEQFRILVVVTARLEFKAPWLPQERDQATLTRGGEGVDSVSLFEHVGTHVPTIKLGPLRPNDGAVIAAHVAGGTRVSSEMLGQIAEKADGIPLYLEELTRALLETGALDSADTGEARSASVPFFIPSTLDGLLLARLDRLPEGSKGIAQIASCIGRECSRDLLATVADATGEALDAEVAVLVESDILQLSGEGASTMYRFRHALIQEAAYKLMLNETRQRLHGSIAQVLERQFPMMPAYPEVLARHFMLAGAYQKAADYWNQAGIRDAERAANQEASDHFREALATLDKLPEGSQRDDQERDLQVRRSRALSLWRGYAAPQVDEALTRADLLSRRQGDPHTLFPVLRHVCTFHIVRATLRDAEGLARDCVRLGEETKFAPFFAEGFTALGYIKTYFGDLEEGASLLSRAVDSYDSHRETPFPILSQQDPRVASLCLLSHVRCLQGRFESARTLADEAIGFVDELAGPAQRGEGRPFERAYAHGYRAMLETLMGRPEAAKQHAESCLAIANSRVFPIWQGVGYMQLGMAKAAIGIAQGEGGRQMTEEALGVMNHMFGEWWKLGARLSGPFCLGWIARARRALGDLDGAAAAIESGLEDARETGERYFDADLLRLKGELLAAMGERAAAVQQLQAALEVASRQGAKLLEMRAAASLMEVADPASGSVDARSRLLAVLSGIDQDCPDVESALAALAH